MDTDKDKQQAAVRVLLFLSVFIRVHLWFRF